MKKIVLLLFLVASLSYAEDFGSCDLSKWPGVDEYSEMYKEICTIFELYELVGVTCELYLTDFEKTVFVDGSEFEHPMPWVCLLVTFDGVNKTTYVFSKTTTLPERVVL